MKSFGISITATYFSYFVSLLLIGSMDSVDTLDELASSFEMQSLCLFPPATVCPLIVPSLFFFENMWDSNTLALWVLSISF